MRNLGVMNLSLNDKLAANDNEFLIKKLEERIFASHFSRLLGEKELEEKEN